MKRNRLMTILLWILSLLATMILTSLLQDTVDHLLSFLPSRGGQRIKGEWKVSYTIDGRTETAPITMRQVSRRVFGVTGKTAPSGFVFSTKGRIDDGVFSGTWNDSDSTSRIRGVFQVHLSPDGNKMTGRWLSDVDAATIRSGEITWTRNP